MMVRSISRVFGALMIVMFATVGVNSINNIPAKQVSSASINVISVFKKKRGQDNHQQLPREAEVMGQEVTLK